MAGGPWALSRVRAWESTPGRTEAVPEPVSCHGRGSASSTPHIPGSGQGEGPGEAANEIILEKGPHDLSQLSQEWSVFKWQAGLGGELPGSL